MLLAGVLLFTSLPSVSAASPEYADLYIKVHINTKDGRLYTFNPESPETDDAFTIGFTPIKDPDISNIDAFKQNRDFAQSLFLQIEGFPSIAQYNPHATQSETALLVNGTGFKQNDPASNNNRFLLSPYDGFLHFKVQKNANLLSSVKVSIVPPTNISQEFQIDPDTTHENHTITRSDLPYGLWNKDEAGAPAGGIYEETIDFLSIFTQNPNVKTIVVDLIVMRHEGRLMPLIVPPSTNNVQSNWIPSELVTYVQQFAIRAHHALDWILKIDNWGVDHTAITKYYNKITSVVNGFLILIILVIALMWNFSIVIPRSRLRKVMMMYVIVSIVVNFSTPVIKLIIDGSNILQTSFMVTKDKQTGEFRKIEAKDFFDFGGLEYNNFLGYDLENGTETRPVRSLSVEGTLTNLNTQFNVTGNGTITIPEMHLGGGSLHTHESDANGSNARSGTIEDPERNITGGRAPLTITGNIAPQQTIDLGRKGLNIHIEYPINTRLEDRLFNSALLILSGIGYYLVGLVFLFRIVVLWFLIILSPLLVLLMIMPAMQQYFRYWAQVFVRWIAIGPLLAICIGATVFIWKEIGIPLTSLYSSHLTYLQSTNFAIASPGSISTGLNYTKPMMEYIVGLLMLYIPVLLAFWLTRKLPCCFSDSNKSIVAVRTKLQPSHLESPEPVPSPSPSKEPPVGDILTNIKLAPAGPVEPEDGMFLSPEEKEEKIRASSVSAIPITKEQEEAISFEEQSTEEPKHVGTVNINTAQEDGVPIGLSRDQQQDAVTKEQSEWGISQFVESSPSFTGLSTADLMEQYQNLEQQKQQEREEGNVINIISQQMALADEIKHRAQMGDQEAQQIAVELDLHPEQRERENRLEADKQAYLHQKQAGSIQQDQLVKTSLSQTVSGISSPQEYRLPQEEIRGLTSGTQEDTQQEENDVEEIIRPYRTTHKAQAEMLEMDMDREAMEHMSMLQQQENEYEQYNKLEKGKGGAEERKDGGQEKSMDKTTPKGKKNNKKDDENDSSDDDNGSTSMDQKEESPSQEEDAEMKRIENEDDSDLFHDTGEEALLLPHEERKKLHDGEKEDQQGPEDVLEKIKKPTKEVPQEKELEPNDQNNIPLPTKDNRTI